MNITNAGTKIRACGIVSIALVCGSSLAAEDPLLLESRVLVKAFGSTLQRELKQGMAEGGPVAALSICKDRAPQIASELSRSSGVKVRRTSLRFRNPVNAPENWEARVLQEFERQAENPGKDVVAEYFAREEDGTVRYMSVIRTAAVCLVCHGKELAPEVTSKLDTEYPHDRAKNYKIDDVRGAFSLSWPAGPEQRR